MSCFCHWRKPENDISWTCHVFLCLPLRDSHDAWDITDGHGPVVGPALSLLILAAVGLLAGWGVVRHFDRWAAGFLALPQLSQLFSQSREVLEKKSMSETTSPVWDSCRLILNLMPASMQQLQVWVIIISVHAHLLAVYIYSLRPKKWHHRKFARQLSSLFSLTAAEKVWSVNTSPREAGLALH